ncbi:MAG: VWA domain-containing protein [Myxococcales bacterium]|nr:VWA domain-containing protein [Myxococcales bacterium]
MALALAWAPACTVADPLPGFGGGGGSVGVTLGPASEDSGDGSDTGGDETDDGSGTGDDDGTGIEPPACSAPDLLVVLDRTGTMYLDPAGNVPAAVEQSRWAIAVGALEQVVQALDGEGTPLDQTVRFGLELFPQHHPDCSTVEESIAGVFPLNPTCQGPELLVEPALGTGASVAGQIDASTGELCESTPLRLAIEGAGSWLAPLASPDHEQLVLLVTDGVDTDSFCSSESVDGYPDSLVAVQQLQAQGVGTLILGVGTGFGTTGSVHQAMNDFACAGGMAPDPELNCVPGAMGLVAVPGLAQALYFSAGDSAALVDRLVLTTEQVCCGCVPVG